MGGPMLDAETACINAGIRLIGVWGISAQSRRTAR
jgi:hypothetical protein